MAHGLRLCIVGVHDGFHRRHNDCWQAMQSSGTVGYFVCKMLELNMSYGPWQSSAWMRSLEDGAMDVATLMTENDPVLLRLWPGICDDMDWLDTEQQGASARRAFLQGLPLLDVFNKKGPKASTSRWMSWQAAFRWHDPYHHTKMLVCLYVALKKGWVNNAADVWCSSTSAEPDVEADGAAAAAAAAPARPTAAVKWTTKPLAAGIASQKGAFLNTFTAVLKSMGNPDLLYAARMLGYLTAGEEKAHAKMASEMKGADKTIEFFSDWAH